MTSVDSNFNFLCGCPHGTWPLPPSTCVHLSLTPSPLRVDVINGWPLMNFINLEISEMLKMYFCANFQYLKIGKKLLLLFTKKCHLPTCDSFWSDGSHFDCLYMHQTRFNIIFYLLQSWNNQKGDSWKPSLLALQSSLTSIIKMDTSPCMYWCISFSVAQLPL